MPQMLAHRHSRRYCTAALFTAVLSLTSPLAAQTATGKAEPLATEIHETVDKLDVSVPLMGGGSHAGRMIITHYRPLGTGPFPIVVLSHGRATKNRHEPPRIRFLPVARYWTTRGFAVVVPTRLGYGATGTDIDPEYSGSSCDTRQFQHTVNPAALQIGAAVDFARRLPLVAPDKIILMGHSVGGLSTTVANARSLPGVIGAINSAGGAGGDPVKRPGAPCTSERLDAIYAAAGRKATTPMLWIYAENDKFWGSAIPRRWHQAFVKSGGKADLVMLSPVGDDGHQLLRDSQAWHAPVDRFIAGLGLGASPAR